MAMTTQHTHNAHHHEHSAGSDDTMTGLLELDGEVLCDYWSAALDWVTSAADGASRVLDLGAGTGTGALGLAERFPRAEVIAVDVDPPAHPRAAEYARAWFSRLSEGFADQIDPDDQATLVALLADKGPGPVSDPARLHIRGIRTVTLARRAGS